MRKEIREAFEQANIAINGYIESNTDSRYKNIINEIYDLGIYITKVFYDSDMQLLEFYTCFRELWDFIKEQEKKL